MHGAWLYVLLFSSSTFCFWAGGMFSGGASLLSVTTLLLFGIPPHLATSTYTFGAIAAKVACLPEYMRTRNVLWRLVWPLSIAGVAGSIVGTYILIYTPDATISKMANVVLLLLVPLMLIRRQLGVEKTVVSKRREYVGYVVYFLLAAWVSFFAAWGGLLLLYGYLLCFGMTILEVKGTDAIPGGLLNVGGAVVFLLHGTYDWYYMAACVPGAFLGAALGAKSAVRLGNARLQILNWLSAAVVGFKITWQAQILRFLSGI